MNKEQYDELVEKLGKQAADQIKAQKEGIEKALNEKFEELKKGSITQKEFDEFKESIKNTELKAINDKLAEIKEPAVEQGKVINEMKEPSGKAVKKAVAD